MTSSISVVELHDLLPLTPDSILIDVRAPFEYNAGHVADAVNIPLSSLPDAIEELKQYSTVYCICASGGRSEIATMQLATQLPATVVNIDGGTSAWVQSGFPVTK